LQKRRLARIGRIHHWPPSEAIESGQDGVWPQELQDKERYTRAGSGNLGAGDISDPRAEHRRSDFCSLRDFDLDAHGLLNDLAKCYKYWIALTDCDGFRIDTLKHVSFDQARNFCGGIKEFAANLGKENFFLVGEIAGGDYATDRYLDALDRNLNAALDIGEMRQVLSGVAKGLVHNSAQEAAKPKRYSGAYRMGSKLPVKRAGGVAYVEIRDLAPSKVLVLAVHPEKEEGSIYSKN
jgi:glycosidase